MIPAYYTPIRDSIINIYSDDEININVLEPLLLPYGGYTLMTPIKLEYGPDIEVIVSI